MNSDRQRAWIEKACGHVNTDRLAEILQVMVDVASPTGEEAELARIIASQMQKAGLEGQEQIIDPKQSNAIGQISGIGGGRSLLLYAPIDTVTSSNADEDLPWAGAELRSDMRSEFYREGDFIFGLGAQNPKGHAACIFAAAEAIKGAGIPLEGDIMIGFGAGGMPTNARAGMRDSSGHGAGCEHMLLKGPQPDYAIIAKSGWSVSWEEVGFNWFEVRVKGTHTYVGSRHLLPYVNAISEAARVILRLEDWFPQWAEDHRSGLVAPQGTVSFIESGWERMPAFTAAECRFLVDLRTSPRTSADDASHLFGAQLDRIANDLGVDLEWRSIVTIPGTVTDENSWVIRASVAAWEAVEGRSHKPATGMSGATDANILRSNGIPTARIGLPKAKIPDMDFALGMNAVDVRDMEKLTRHLIHVAVATCTNTDNGAYDE